MEDFELMKEAGFEIEEVNENPSNLQVIVRYPDKQQTRRSFSYKKKPRWMEEKNYVEDGEVKSKKGWLIDVEKQIEEDIEASEYSVEEDKNLEGEELQF